MTNLVPGLLIAAISTVACASGSGSKVTAGALDCAWFEGDNCWRTTLAMAVDCLPPGSETGTLSADNATCSYAGGQLVTFTPPIVLPSPDEPSWNFTVTGANGQPCLHFQKTGDVKTLVVAGLTVTEALFDSPSGATGMSITCPDGATYEVADTIDLSCPNANDLPNDGYLALDARVAFGLDGATELSLPIFDCTRP